MSKGHIRPRGKQSWELKFDAGRDPVTGKRKIKYHSFKGTKREAQTKLAELIAAVSTNVYIEPNKTTVKEHVSARIDQWEASGAISARTAERYRQLCDGQIGPFIGGKQLQKLSTLDIETWHSTLKSEGRTRGSGGISPRTVVHAHRVLSHALDDAERHGVIQRNVAKRQKPPKVEVVEMPILDAAGIGKVVSELRGEQIYAPSVTALFTGMRLGEILGLRWAASISMQS
ncbi:Arm DNA-binding domain-containing protein [Methyloceanibacter sp.]|uniref:Arm DNA-binding domain-containing protein n=1 Tax=Methyloceanibacter sp. TaxID=1965321 RepID=UPI002C2ED063|nr:Arm DNA-binding domain-containing protein [Methyloceanibacter sp.]HML93254.1 Arm DNA-binding domain-containing protein [Methyloceanibacter sp.]